MTTVFLARLGDFLADRSGRFTRREDGTVTLFGVMMFILMVLKRNQFVGTSPKF